VQHVWQEVVGGELATGERLPTIRQLAVRLNLSPSVVERAYDQLAKLGVVTARPGEGTFVSLAPPSPSERERYLDLERACLALVEEAERLGFGIEDAMDLLTELRLARRGPETRGETR
jgi:GntR family transcriptional regulator